ncbi:hypothetical protein [Flavobacterium sp.]|uniref:hypothetical protein n=1 Tax=Flavobacterium sp. TaxID=239 RepID=UPI00261547DB|nr:hypothetical protein [Flavobacterium sp.]
MKHTFNYLLKTFLLSFVILFISCETQEEVVSSSKRDIKKTNITLKELSSKPNAVSKIQEFKTKKSNMDSGKLVYNEEYDFFIDDQNMLLIEEGSKHWITIPIYRKKPNANLENIILKPDENGLYKSFLASYQLTDQDRENIKNGIPVLDLDIKTSLYAVEGKHVGQLYDLGNGICGYVHTIDQIGPSTIETTFVVAPCNGTQIQFGYAENVPSNTTGGASGYVPSGYIPNFNTGNNTSGFPTGNGSNGTQQTSGISNSNNNILTEPTLSYEEAALTSFVKNLSVEQREFLFPTVSIDSLQQNTENETWTSIVNFFGENGQTAENEEFVEDMINTCNENGGSFVIDDTITEDNALVFDDVEEFENYFNSISITPFLESNEIIEQENGHKGYFTFKLNSYTGVTLIANIVDHSDGTSTITSATTVESGLYIMSDWTQKGEASITTLPSGASKIVVIGTVKTNSIIESIGISVSNTYELTVVYNPNTGIVISSSCVKI